MSENAAKTDPANDNKSALSAACPICGRPREARYTPFCSRRCADVDLYRWLKGSYVIPASHEGDDRASAGDRDEDE
jgi:endogenous inhibitor of DNA gyrase (YacG/DUF329 family)